MRLAPAFSCLAIIAGLAACGSTTTTATPVTTATSATTTVAVATTTPAGAVTTVAGDQSGGNGQSQLTPAQQTARQTYRDCLTANGLTLPQRGNGAAGNLQGQAGSQNPAAAGSDPNQTPPSSDNGTPRPTVDPTALAKAQDACKDKLPAGGAGNIFGGGGNRPNGAARAAALAPFYSCLKDNGIKVADAPATTTTVAGAAPATTVAGQQPGQGGQRAGRLAGVDQTTPEFIAANEKCKVLVPAGTNLPGQGGNNGAKAGNPPPAPNDASTTVAA